MGVPRFDVFLSHNRADAPVVERIAERLRDEGLQPWLDRWQAAPGSRWQREIAQGLRTSRACAVFVGPHGLGDWAREELEVAQDRATKDPRFRLFMVLLPGALHPDDPSLDFLANRTWVDLRAGIIDRDGFQDLLSAITGAPRRTATIGAEPGRCPYRGLEVFEKAHAELFFGRAADTARMVEKLKDSRFLAVLGPSGCGKSSLVRAGVVPALTQGALPGSAGWPVHLVMPGARPLSVLAALLVGLAPGDSMQRTLDGLRGDERSLDLAASLALAQRPAAERLVLVVDQLEEAFTLCAEEAERAAFLANLCYAATIPGGRLMVLVAMRADFYHRCAPYPQLRALIAARQFLVGPLDRAGLREAIERPAWRVKLELETGLAETILDDVADRPGTLPLLEYVLLEVWRRRRGSMLTLDAYVASGGVEGALAQRADAVYEALTPAQQRLARRVLLRLVQPGEGTEDTRRRAEIAELRSRAEEEADLEAVVKAFADARLLVVDSLDGARLVDVAHEALIRGWPKLRAWIDEGRALLLALRRLTEAAVEWDHGGWEEGSLYRGARLAAWSDRPVEDLNDLERAFLAASRERETRDRDARRRRIRLALIGLSVALVIISILAVVAFVTRNQAVSRKLAVDAATQASTDPELSLLLARQAFETSPTQEARAALRQAISDSLVRKTLNGHTDVVYGVDFSPDGRQVVSASEDGTVRVWDLATETFTKLPEQKGPANDVAFSRMGQRVASAGRDGAVRVWDMVNPSAAPLVLPTSQAQVNHVAFSGDGQRLAGSSADGTVRVWDLDNPAPPLVFTDHRAGTPVRSVALSPDGQWVASASEDTTVRLRNLSQEISMELPQQSGKQWYCVAFSPDGRRVAAAGRSGVHVWDLANPSNPLTFSGHNGSVRSVAFSPDGQRVASASEDRTIRVQDLEGKDPVILSGHGGSVLGVAFSPDGRLVASAGGDGTVRLWASGDAAVLQGHKGSVWSVALSPDGQRVASASFDSTVRVWDLSGRAEPVELKPHNDWARGVAFSPDGRRVASTDEYGGVRVWDPARPTDPPIRLRGHEGQAYSPAFSPGDGHLLISAGKDSTIRVWDWKHEQLQKQLQSHGFVYTAAFSPDGRWVAGGGTDGTIRIWDVAGSENPTMEFPSGQGTVWSVAFSPDGRFLASAGKDSTVRVWDLEHEVSPIVLHGHKLDVMAVAFSPDGRLVASGGADETVRIWEWRSKAKPVVLNGHQGTVNSVSFSPDGAPVVSGGADHTVRVWQCEVCGLSTDAKLLELANERITRDLTCDERAAFLNASPCAS
jgi:WD40 repeat protein/energy-coupling factor transporter ATP-binding protein EcfA2